MRLKQKLATMLAVLLILLQGFPAFAVTAQDLQEPENTTIEQDSGTPSSPTEKPATPGEKATALTTELVTVGDAPGLYVTLKDVPPDLSEVVVKYAFGSPKYIFEDFSPKVWYTSPDGDEALCQVNEDGSVRLLCYEISEHPLWAYLSGAVNTLWIEVSYATQDYADGMTFEPVRFSHENSYEIPVTPPPFTAEFELGWFSYSVVGHFSDFPPNVAQVSSTYSWDGVEYQSCGLDGPMRWNLQNLGSEDATAKTHLQNQECAEYYAEPLKSFLARQRNSFYLRLEITTEDGNIYYSQPALMSRFDAMEIPEYLTPRAYMGFDMAVIESRNDKGLSEDDENYYAELVNYTYGQFQLTVREDATQEEIMALLPDTVPVRVRFWDKDTNQKVAFGDVACKVNWKALPAFSLTAGEPFTLENAAEPLVIPAGTPIETDLATYTLTQPLTFPSPYDSDDIRLILNPVAAGESPRAGLRGGEDFNGNKVLSLAFWNKPSGATAIEAYAIVGEERTLICDLLDRRDVNHNQSHALYGYVPLLYANEAPYGDYLSGTLDSFTIELAIKGGVYDGQTVTLPWPQDYELPEEVFDPVGGEGQENNAGSSNGGGDSTEGGQRPNLPDEEAPPITQPSPDTSNPPPGSGGDTVPSTPDPPIVPHTMPPTESADKASPPTANQPTIKPGYPAEQPPVTDQGNSAEPKADKDSALPVWNEVTTQEQTQEKSDVQTITREVSAAEKTTGLPIAATGAIVLVGGVIAVSVGVGVASGTVSGSGFFSKLLGTLRKLFHRP